MIFSKNDSVPYIYKWTQVSTGKWYIGSKIKKGWNPSRHEQYVCSSKIVKPLVLSNRADWIFEIICIGDASYIKEMEVKILTELNAKNDPLSYNLHNGNGICSRYGVNHSSETKKRMSNSRSGNNHWSNGRLDPYKHMIDNNPMHNPDIALKISQQRMGDNNIMKSPEIAEKVSKTRKLLGLASGDKNPSRLPQYQMTCEHCGKIFAKGQYVRWHGDKCKKKPISDKY